MLISYRTLVYCFAKTIGKGSFGTVKQTKVKATGAVRAVKSISKDAIAGRDSTLAVSIECIPQWWLPWPTIGSYPVKCRIVQHARKKFLPGKILDAHDVQHFELLFGVWESFGVQVRRGLEMILRYMALSKHEPYGFAASSFYNPAGVEPQD